MTGVLMTMGCISACNVVDTSFSMLASLLSLRLPPEHGCMCLIAPLLDQFLVVLPMDLWKDPL